MFFFKNTKRTLSSLNLIARFFSSTTATYRHNYHDFHLVDPSIWPVFTALGALLLTNGSVIYFHSSDPFWMKLGLIQVIVGMVGW